ncbi:MAG: maltose alpha-D-glucosyltransferase [Deltaproteobacteria bacterium]|nr:maltose alpha-D-glucosyltransferase [Deltaproteobacteria bacterium]
MKDRRNGSRALESDALWYKDAIIYETHVRAFYDANGDGIGDFRGLTQKLDYLQDLGVTALWLLPFYPSPLRDDGYDIADYTDIHPHYGNLQDFNVFLKEAHSRGLRVITELVVNHTSDEHAWFQRARRARPDSRARDFYVWNDTPEKYTEARIIFKDFETSNWSWDPVARAYFWHRFYSHQPDLNFANPEVRKALFKVVDFWLAMGIDGMRLDAVPYLYEQEGTTCENLPETHVFLKELRQYVDKKYGNRMLLAEANQWPEEAVPYFGEGDECHMAFHFPVMPRLFMAIYMEDRFPIIDILDQTPRAPETCQWALFLRNHDELTLEMVTDEDRDYMYKVYAQDPQARINLGIRRRLAPLLGNNRRKIELMKSLLFSLPGTPVIYYGDEIGMGDNIYLGDRNGVRTPMHWSADRNAGFSRANPQRLYLPVIIDPEYHYEAINVEAQSQNLHSFLWWMKRLILLRKRFQAFGRGTIEFLYPENPKVLTFIRRFRDEIILVVANLSRFVNFVELDLSAFKGMVPVELFSQNHFPPIGELPYFITLGPHAFYWFELEPPRISDVAAAGREQELGTIEVTGFWGAILEEKGQAELEKFLPNYLKSCRWFGGKARQIRAVKITEKIRIPSDSSVAYLTVAEVQYGTGTPENYLLPLVFRDGERAVEIEQAHPNAVIARLRIKGKGWEREGALFDALFDSDFCKSLLDAISRRRRFKGESGEITATPSKLMRKIWSPEEKPLEPSFSKREQSNTSVTFGDRFILKVFRRLQEGVNPDLEIGRFILEKTSFRHIPPLAGSLEYQRNHSDLGTVGILHGLVPNEGDAWRYTLHALGQYFDQALARAAKGEKAVLPNEPMQALIEKDIPSLPQETIGSYGASASLLGLRTGELHMALASRADDPAFAPEPFTPFYRRALYQSLRTLADQSLSLLGKRLRSLPEDICRDADRVLGLKREILDRFRQIVDRKNTAMRIRCHGDYHLGQVLFTGKDFVIIDFEGEPARPIGERRIKRSPLRDVAGMLRSFNYASIARLKTGEYRPEDLPDLREWARFWNIWVSVIFLKAYLDIARAGSFLPHSSDELGFLLDLYLLEKAVYELGYELNNRPEWLGVPLEGILQLMGRAAE